MRVCVMRRKDLISTQISRTEVCPDGQMTSRGPFQAKLFSDSVSGIPEGVLGETGTIPYGEADRVLYLDPILCPGHPSLGTGILFYQDVNHHFN